MHGGTLVPPSAKPYGIIRIVVSHWRHMLHCLSYVSVCLPLCVDCLYEFISVLIYVYRGESIHEKSNYVFSQNS
jgi:hypothetical protein